MFWSEIFSHTRIGTLCLPSLHEACYNSPQEFSHHPTRILDHDLLDSLACFLVSLCSHRTWFLINQSIRFRTSEKRKAKECSSNSSILNVEIWRWTWSLFGWTWASVQDQTNKQAWFGLFVWTNRDIIFMQTPKAKQACMRASGNMLPPRCCPLWIPFNNEDDDDDSRVNQSYTTAQPPPPRTFNQLDDDLWWQWWILEFGQVPYWPMVAIVNYRKWLQTYMLTRQS